MKSKLLIEKFKIIFNNSTQRSKMAWRSKGKDNQELISQMERMLHFLCSNVVYIYVNDCNHRTYVKNHVKFFN